MSSEIAAVGDIITGGLLASAIEPETGGPAKSGDGCLNCGFSLQGNHCHNCGQKARVHRTLGAFGHDILHSVLHFDGKIWRTLPLLAWYPGELTRRYVHGERAKFVSPLALFLFTVFLTFAVFNSMGLNDTSLGTNVPVTAAQAAKELANDRADLEKDIKELENDRKEALASKAPVGWIDREIARNRDLLRKLENETAPDVRKRAIAERKFAIKSREMDAEIAKLEQRRAAAVAKGEATTGIDEDLEGARTVRKVMGTATNVLNQSKDNDWTFTDIDFWGAQSLNEAARHASENPQLLIYKIQSNAYKFSWALIPISVPFVWLLFFWRRQFKLFDHAVFVTYSLCFMMTLAAVGGVILTLSDEDGAVFVLTILALSFFPPIHMYRQIHRGYQTSRFGALWRTFVLSNFAMIAFGVFVSLIFALGVTG